MGIVGITTSNKQQLYDHLVSKPIGYAYICYKLATIIPVLDSFKVLRTYFARGTGVYASSSALKGLIHPSPDVLKSSQISRQLVTSAAPLTSYISIGSWLCLSDSSINCQLML